MTTGRINQVTILGRGRERLQLGHCSPTVEESLRRRRDLGHLDLRVPRARLRRSPSAIHLPPLSSPRRCPPYSAQPFRMFRRVWHGRLKRRILLPKHARGGNRLQLTPKCLRIRMTICHLSTDSKEPTSLGW